MSLFKRAKAVGENLVNLGKDQFKKLPSIRLDKITINLGIMSLAVSMNTAAAQTPPTEPNIEDLLKQQQRQQIEDCKQTVGLANTFYRKTEGRWGAGPTSLRSQMDLIRKTLTSIKTDNTAERLGYQSETRAQIDNIISLAKTNELQRSNLKRAIITPNKCDTTPSLSKEILLAIDDVEVKTLNSSKELKEKIKELYDNVSANLHEAHTALKDRTDHGTPLDYSKLTFIAFDKQAINVLANIHQEFFNRPIQQWTPPLSAEEKTKIDKKLEILRNKYLKKQL